MNGEYILGFLLFQKKIKETKYTISDEFVEFLGTLELPYKIQRSLTTKQVRKYIEYYFKKNKLIHGNMVQLSLNFQLFVRAEILDDESTIVNGNNVYVRLYTLIDHIMNQHSVNMGN